MKSEWFASWFDTPYYHILYKNRDHEEAQRFIDKLIAHLSPAPKAKMLDLACGKGRHSIYLAEKGFDLTGVDLSAASIQYARQFETPQLSFFTHDVRAPFRTNYFDYIFNFFTSFGYFEKDRDHFKTLKNIALGLQPKGIFVIDFLSVPFALARLKATETQTIDGIQFFIERVFKDGYIVKTISFTDKGQDFQFQEKVRGFQEADFLAYFEQLGLKHLHTFGNYELEPYQSEDSPRLILIAQKL